MFAFDPSGTIVSWNEGVEMLLGYSEEEWLGQHASIIFTPTDNAIEVCSSEMTIAAKAGSSSDIRWHLRKDGSVLFANGYMTPIVDDDGVLIGYSKVLSDETQTKQLQDSLTESNQALEQFASIAGHDLQEPLRTITSYAELLNRRVGDTLHGDEHKFLTFIINGAKRMSTLVSDLLAYARTTTEVDRPVSMSLDQDLETALSFLDASIVENEAVVTHDPLPEIPADQGQIVRLFQNLIGNALKYRSTGAPPRVHVSALREGAYWIVTISDNGIGFDEKYAEAIFAPFKRLHSESEYAGSGVGLAICRRVVEGHGGKIWARSTPGKGSSFSFSLPAEGKVPKKFTSLVTQGLHQQ